MRDTYFSRFWRRHITRRIDTLVVECAPLHTETAAVAAQAPAQVTAALLRGADVIGFTEVHSTLATTLAGICAKHGYGFVHGKGDTAMAYKMTLDVTASGQKQVNSTEFFSFVTFNFHGSVVTVFDQHWHTNGAAGSATIRADQSEALIEAMDLASAGGRIGLYMGDSNPDKPLSTASSDPRATLDHAGMPLVYEAVGFPAGIGVTTVGYNAKDSRVKPISAVTHDALGSDHVPCTVTLDITRPKA